MIAAENKYDVVVAGGGIAGICAAVKAARLGVRTLLVEQYGFCGGMSTAGMVSPFMKHSVNGMPLVKGIFSELETEMLGMKGMIDNGFYASAFRLAAYRILISSGCEVLLNSEIISVALNEDTVESIEVTSNGVVKKISGKIFIDTTGDAQLLFLGGLPWKKGDEETGSLQALTMFFRMANLDMDKAAKYITGNKDNFFGWMDYNFAPNRIISVAGYFREVKKAIMEKRLSPEVQYIFYTTLPEQGEASFNTTNILELDGSSSRGLTKAEIKGREQVGQIVSLLVNEIPGFENSFLLETAPQVGVRETRRAEGDYIFTGDDVREGRKFKDAVARACYGIDIHGQKNEQSVMEHLGEGQYYEIPLRALFVSKVKNVLAAGRCVSSTHEGQSALRIMPTSAAMGEACGAAAALAARTNKELRAVPYIDIQSLLSHNLSSGN